MSIIRGGICRPVAFCTFCIADCKNLRTMERIDWLNAIGLIVCKTDNEISKGLMEEVEKVVEGRTQDSVSGR